MNTTTEIPGEFTDQDLADLEALLQSIDPEADLLDTLTELRDHVKRDRKKAAKAVKKAKAKKAKAKAKARTAKARAKRAKKAIENADVNYARLHTLVNGSITGVLVGAAVRSNPIFLGGLAATSGARTVRDGFKWRKAHKVRKQVRKGAVVEEQTLEQRLVSYLSEQRFDAITSVLDAGLMGGMGVYTKQPAWAILAAVNGLSSAHSAAAWGVARNELRIERGEAEEAGHKVGAHKGTRLVTA